MIPTPDEVAALIRLLHQRYQHMGDSLARKAAWALESLSPAARMAGETPETDAKKFRIPIHSDQGLPTGDYHEVVSVEDAQSLERRLRALREEREGMVMVPRKLLILWHRVMLQSTGEYEERCAAEIGELLSTPSNEQEKKP